MSGSLYGGNPGDGVVNVAANPAALTDLGLSMEDITAQTPTPGPMQQALNALSALFGVNPAAAAGIYSGATLVGWLDFTPSGPMTLHDALGYLQATLQPNGFITLTSGAHIGMMQSGFYGVSLNGIVVQIDTVTGPVNLDSIVETGTITDATGHVYPIGGIKSHVWSQISQLKGCAIQWPTNRAWNATGINSSLGVPVMNVPNIQKMFGKQNSFLLPGFIAGRDGIYSLHTGRRAVPAPTYGAAPVGFDVGSYANYGQHNLLLGGTAAGRYVLLKDASEPVHVIDPSTSAVLVPTVWAYVKVFGGSQQCNLILQPAYQYTGPNPTAAAPGYNSDDPVSPVLAVTNLLISNGAITSRALFLQQNPSYNWGGPEGPSG